MPHQNSTQPTSPLVPIDSNEEVAMTSRHDGISSAPGLEIDELKEKVKELECIKASLIWGRDQLSQECNVCRKELAKEKQEVSNLAGELSKESRKFKAEMITLREDTKWKICNIEKKLDREKKKRAKENQDAKEAIAVLQSHLDVKQSRVEELEAQFSEKKRYLLDPQAKTEVTRATSYRPLTSSLACKPIIDEPVPTQSSILPKLHGTITYLQKENERLQGMHHEDGCNEYRKLIFQQLEDAKDLQAAAEAETEGLRHLAKANADLAVNHAADTKCIKELIQQIARYSIETEQHEENVGKLHVEQNLASRSMEEPEAASAAPQPLGFSAVSCLASEPELASSSNALLSFSGLQIASTIPLTPIPTSTLLSNPALLSELEDLGRSIMCLSTAPPPKANINPPTKLQPTPSFPNVALTITIQPTDKHNYSLLQRVQSAISATSSLDIHGPKDVVKQFVASMHDIETDHVEKSKLVIQLGKVIDQYRADTEALEAQLRDKRKCSVPEHRMLVDELQAKNTQFAMQAQLLADWRRRNV